MPVPNPPPLTPTAGVPGEVLAVADQWLRELRWDEGWVRRQGNAWIFGGVWELSYHDAEGRFAMRKWSFGNQDWEPVDLRSGALTTHTPKSSPLPCLEWRSKMGAEEARDTLLLEVCHQAAVAAQQQHASELEEDDFWFVDEQLSARWATPQQARGLAKEMRSLRDELTDVFGKPFIAAVSRVRQGKTVDLSDLLAAWPHREALLEAAVTHPQLLPLMGHIAFAHWTSAGWRHAEGWMQSLATFRVVDNEMVTTSPWGEGSRWFESDLPVFLRKHRAQAWVRRPAYAYPSRVWGSREALRLFEHAWVFWKQQAWWPGSIPNRLRFLLERLHHEMSERLDEPPPQAHVSAMAEGLVGQWLGGRGPREAKDLEEEWDALLTQVDGLGEVPRFDRLGDLPVTHPWVAQKKQERLNGAWGQDLQAPPAERARL